MFAYVWVHTGDYMCVLGKILVNFLVEGSLDKCRYKGYEIQRFNAHNVRRKLQSFLYLISFLCIYECLLSNESMLQILTIYILLI